MAKNLSIVNNGCSCRQAPKAIAMEKLQRPFPRGSEKTIEVRRNRNGVGENPLNGKGVPLTHNGEGEEMVLSYMKV